MGRPFFFRCFMVERDGLMVRKFVRITFSRLPMWRLDVPAQDGSEEAAEQLREVITRESSSVVTFSSIDVRAGSSEDVTRARIEDAICGEMAKHRLSGCPQWESSWDWATQEEFDKFRAEQEWWRISMLGAVSKAGL